MMTNIIRSTAFAAVSFFILLFSNPLFADTVYLKNGSHVDGVIEHEAMQRHAPPGTYTEQHVAGTLFGVEMEGTIDFVTANLREIHDYKKHSNHPIGEKITDPRNGNLTLDCLSCHRNHGSPFKAFAHYDTDAELCVQCHEGMRR